MIEFELKRATNGKKSRWSKKFPRKRILHRGLAWVTITDS